ncbi:hypothetical protein BJF93_13660 [Xaviernesmea oryzae]|uniref:Uncharacterized protein n=1 Tax=Xaviernesmea oryzae TaxID=464029 RepID=A0A1Q9ARE5_9HYPH|nr:EAL domain-containing protein [Xaviernesmea oryzae]OLP57885.1 hypothetical protein BJF93_13660 [Xaviernesmea oryzae]SEL32552.1 diguanylate cyclase (GGDEF) domain-containing protein [Xaviernesmea oryzae]
MIVRASSELPGPLRQIRVPLVLITAALAVSAIICSLLAVQYQERIMKASRYNDAFDLSQTAIELLRFQSVVQDFLVSGDARPIDLRLNILKNRSQISAAREDIRDAEHKAFVARLQALLASIPDGFGARPQPDAARAVLQGIAPLISPCLRIASRAHSQSGDIVLENQVHLQYIFAALCIVILALVLFGAVLVAFVSHQNRKLDAVVRLDNLTGLANRLGFNAAVTGAKDDVMGVLLVDVDHFKALNDTLGHDVGDLLLAKLAERLTICAPDATAIARIGGDEFALLYCGRDAEERSRRAADMIIQSMTESVIVDEREIDVSVTIGMCIGSGAAERSMLFNHADLALYRAKSEGRGQYRVFVPSMRDDLLRRQRLMNDLRGAIRRNELFLLFQPIVCTVSGNTSGFEALLRWHHPELDLVPPSEFIDLAEKSGQIEAIGAWVIEQACRAAAQWPEDLFISVNVSARQLTDMSLIAVVTDSIAAHAVNPRRLVIEITESTLIDNDTSALSVLHALKRLGCRIALDDFGTGYASLSYLRRFPFDKLKIDQSFLRQIGDKNSDSAKIVRAIGDLGRQMDLLVVAEGVETQEQLDLVREAGSVLGQGYLFDRPLTLDAARHRVARERGLRQTAVFHSA